MRTLLSIVLASATLAVLPAAAIAQTRKPTAKPAPRSVARPTSRPAARPATPAPAPRTAAAPAPAPVAAPVPTPAPTTVSAPETPFGVGTNVLNLGLGLGSRYSYNSFLGGTSSVSPALSVSFERGIMPLGPGVLGVGALLGYQSASYEFSGYKDKFTDIIVMARGTFHYPVAAQFDAYAGVGLGFRYAGYSSSYTGPFASTYSASGATAGLFAGGRYYFTPSIGAFAELGYDQTYLKAGLTAKF